MRSGAKKSLILLSVVWVVTIGVVVYGYIFVLGPQFAEIRKLDDQIAVSGHELVEARVSLPKRVEADLREKLSAATQKLGKFIVSHEDALNFTVNINRIAQQSEVSEFSGTHRINESYSAINECDHIVEGRMHVTFKASFNQFASFINLLERNRPVIFVDNFKIIRSEANDGWHDVDMILTFFVGGENAGGVLTADLSDLNTSMADKPAVEIN